LVNALGGDLVVIVGHDRGAWIAQVAALFRPDNGVKDLGPIALAKPVPVSGVREAIPF
jgi:pimeloyl-ACP methyl ester carboxylesterase